MKSIFLKLIELLKSSESIGTAIESKPLTQAFKDVSKINLLLTVIITAAIRYVMLMRTVMIGVATDDIASQLAATSLAGLDWSGIASTISYHGPAYYIIFAPIYMLTNDPKLILFFILMINSLFIALFSVVIYIIAVHFCKLPDKWYSVLFVVFLCGSQFLPVIAIRGRNELPVFFVVWLTALLLFQAASSYENKKRRNIATIILVLVLLWGMFIHTRLEVLIIMIGLVIPIYFLLYKVWILAPHIFYPVIVLCYIIKDVVSRHVISPLYGGRDFTDISNTTISPYRVFTNDSFSFEAFFDSIISNATSLITQTYGLAVVVFVLLVYIIYKMSRRAFVERIRTDNDFVIPREQLVVLLVFAGSVLATIAGIYLRFGHQINEFYVDESNRYVFRWFVYVRYYRPFFGPLLLIIINYANENVKKMQKMLVASIGLFILMYAYVALKIMPWISQRTDNTLQMELLLRSFDGTMIDIYGTGAVVMGFLGGFYLLLSVRKPLLMCIPLLAFSLSSDIAQITAPILNISAPTARLATTYEILMHVNAVEQIPKHIHTNMDGQGRRGLQFMLNRNTILTGLPDEFAPYGIFVGLPVVAERQSLHDMGYKLYNFPDGANIWFRGDYMIKALRQRALDYNERYALACPYIVHLLQTAGRGDVQLIGIPDIWVYQSMFPYIRIVNNVAHLPPGRATNFLRQEPSIIFANRRNIQLGNFIGTHKLVWIDSSATQFMLICKNEEDLITRIEDAGYICIAIDTRTFDAGSLRVLHNSIFTPLVHLPRGSYEVTILGNGLGFGRYEAAHTTGEHDINIRNLQVSDSKVTFNFTLDSDERYVEFKIINDGSGGGISADVVHLRITERVPNNMVTLGHPISFRADNQIYRIYDRHDMFTIRGLHAQEEDGVWTQGDMAEFAFRLPKRGADIIFSFTTLHIMPNQEVLISANGYEVAALHIDEPGTQEVVIPATVVADGCLHLIFYLPNTISPYEVGWSADGRQLGLFFSQFILGVR